MFWFCPQNAFCFAGMHIYVSFGQNKRRFVNVESAFAEQKGSTLKASTLPSFFVQPDFGGFKVFSF
jgi:hypothetical protein